MTIDIVSPDALFRRVLCEQGESGNEAGGWPEKPVPFSSPAEAMEVWSKRPPEMIVLDADALGGDSSRLTEALENADPAPVLFLLGEPGRVGGHLPVAEFFEKPVRLGHLLARGRLHRQLAAAHRDAVFAVGPWRFLPGARQMWREETETPAVLTEKETSLLVTFCRADGPLSRNEILEAVWGYDGRIDTHTFETHLYRLRSKLMEVEGTKPDGDVFLVEESRYRLNPSWKRS